MAAHEIVTFLREIIDQLRNVSVRVVLQEWDTIISRRNTSNINTSSRQVVPVQVFSTCLLCLLLHQVIAHSSKPFNHQPMNLQSPTVVLSVWPPIHEPDSAMKPPNVLNVVAHQWDAVAVDLPVCAVSLRLPAVMQLQRSTSTFEMSTIQEHRRSHHLHCVDCESPRHSLDTSRRPSVS